MAALVSLLISPVSAHTVHTAGNVAAIFHIEPNHNPKAGEPAQAWFALTKAGGIPIALSECNCQLAVYDAVKADQPIQRPPLVAIAAEQYQNLPGAKIVFPQAGIYRLELQGAAKDGTSFNPFKLSYEVTVQPGEAPVATAQPAATAAASPASSTTPLAASAPSPNSATGIVGGAIGIVVLLGTGWALWTIGKRKKT
jgi:hypothetical protein